MNYSYPLLNKVFNYYKHHKIDLSNFFLYSCQHLLAPQYEMYKMFIEFGFKPGNIVALGKVYSSNMKVIKKLKDLGIKVIQPEFNGISFNKEHTKNCKLVTKNIFNKNKNIILDDGGYLINESKTKNIYFAVEQTSSGFNKLNKIKFNFPVFNVARSKTKLTQESPLIGRLIFERIKIYIQDKKINSVKILVVGLGPIGNAVYQIFNEEKFNITGFDIERDKKDILSYLKNKKPNIVIGATGTELFNESDLKNLENNHVFHFISVSSSDIEFPVCQFRENEGIHGDVNYKNFVFVNNGFPITFKGNEYESTPIEIEKTIALLMGSVLYGIHKKKGVYGGIINIPRELENLINR